ncbi:hypothetical protein MHUMG1_08509 [Metarhizium humberi]|uniref:Dimethylallyl tryptophan synthase GliD1 n=1 Tax=Metarhizium humberi TaxID=2596975 RepID=A0A9P8M4E9_9HYPO|nr:hypothetical protein MHUMG1_08509 [Metarhizium humberi]
MAKCSASDHDGELIKAWASLSTLLPSRGPDCDYWWQLTGMHLASLMEAAGYAIERQYEALLFHYHWMIPYMGPAPGPDGRLEWPTPLTVEGLPVEYSWKWNTATRRPVVRYTIEAKNGFTGTSMDPLNQDPSRELLHRLQMSLPGVDLTWYNHFLATLYDHDRSKYADEVVAGAEYTTSIMIAAELDPDGLSTKTYFIPQKVGLSLGDLPVSSLMKAIAGVCPESAAKRMLEEFLTTFDGILRPTMLAVDNVEPSESRLKFYFQSPRTDFSSVRDIMTLGGRVAIPETQLQDLRSLLNAAAGVDEDYAEDVELPLAVQFNPPITNAREEKTLVLPGFGYYFDIAPGREYPEVKIFLRLSAYGQDDLSMGRGITAWMAAHGRGEYCHDYMSALETLPHGRQLSEGKGVHTHVSCLFKKDGTLDITSYLVPEISSRPRMLYQSQA